MFQLLRHRTYRHLFAAHVVSILGSGLATVALGLLAYDIAGASGALVLGVILTIKMVAYVTIAPVAGALATLFPRRGLLVGLDLVRAAVALALPFVTEVWQIYALMFLIQSASAAFTPIYQATLPDVLTDEEDYTRALSLSRLAYDLETLLSPLLAALLLSVLSYHILFVGTVAGFAASALFVLAVALPPAVQGKSRSAWDKTTRGTRIYLATPRLRGLLAISFATAAAGAMVLVNSVMLVRDVLGLSDQALALTMIAFGLGSICAALALPRVLRRVTDRSVMIGSAGLMVGAVALLGALAGGPAFGWPLVLCLWGLLGLGFSAALTPGGRLLRRSAHPEDRPAIFAAHFALSHACWLITYPLAGVLMTQGGLVPTALTLAGFGAIGLGAAVWLWPADDPETVIHTHHNLGPGDPHLRDGPTHAHPLIIDDDHPRWATRFGTPPAARQKETPG